MLSELSALDNQLFFIINKQFANGVLDVVCPVLRNKTTWIPFYVASGVWLLYEYKINGLWIIAAAAITVLLTDQLSASVIKPFFERLRPCNNPGINEQVRLLVHCGKGFSFVSSHAANHFGIALFFTSIYRYKYLNLVLLLWAFAVAFSQVYVGVHYPFDVFCGGILGAAIGYVIAIIYQKVKPATQ